MTETGSELILHGFAHRSSGPLRGSAWTRLRARLFAGGDAEFLSLGRDEAMRRLLAARRLLEQLGLQADGFALRAGCPSPSCRVSSSTRAFASRSA